MRDPATLKAWRAYQYGFRAGYANTANGLVESLKMAEIMAQGLAEMLYPDPDNPLHTPLNLTDKFPPQ